MGIYIKGVSIPKDRDMEIVIHPDGAAPVEIIEDYGFHMIGTDAIDIEENHSRWNCPSKDCEECEFHRTESWCAKAIPINKNVYDEKYRAYMEGFWEALDWAEEHYQWLEKHYEKHNDYIAVLEKLIELCYADDRAPTTEEMTQVNSYWIGEE